MCTAEDYEWNMVRMVEDADGFLQDDVAAAEPSIDEKTSKLVSRGRWGVPGYKVRPPAALPCSQFLLTWVTGKIRRPLRAIEDKDCTFPLCTLAL